MRCATKKQWHVKAGGEVVVYGYSLTINLLYVFELGNSGDDRIGSEQTAHLPAWMKIEGESLLLPVLDFFDNGLME